MRSIPDNRSIKGQLLLWKRSQFWNYNSQPTSGRKTMGKQLQLRTLYPFPMIYKVWLPTLLAVQACSMPQTPHCLSHTGFHTVPWAYNHAFTYRILHWQSHIAQFYHFLNVFAYMSFWRRNIPLPLLLFTILFCSLFLHCTFLLDRLNTYMFINMFPLVEYKLHKFKTLICFLTAVLLITIWELWTVPDPILGAQCTFWGASQVIQ